MVSVGLAITVLSGCAPVSSPGASPADNPSATTTTIPTPSTTTTDSPPRPDPSPLAEVEPASILIGAEATDIVDDAGEVLVSLRYSEDGDSAVVAVTTVLGKPEKTTYLESTPHFSAMDAVKWGGFEIRIIRYTAEYRARVAVSDYQPNFMVLATEARTSSGVVVSSVDGTTVGDEFDAVDEGLAPVRVYNDESFDFRSVALDLPTSFPGIVEGATYPTNAYGVIGSTAPHESVIDWIMAPTYLWSES